MTRRAPKPRPKPRIGEVAVCRACLGTKFERAEAAADRCPCGGTIVNMPRSEVDARRADKR